MGLPDIPVTQHEASGPPLGRTRGRRPQVPTLEDPTLRLSFPKCTRKGKGYRFTETTLTEPPLRWTEDDRASQVLCSLSCTEQGARPHQRLLLSISIPSGSPSPECRGQRHRAPQGRPVQPSFYLEQPRGKGLKSKRLAEREALWRPPPAPRGPPPCWSSSGPVGTHPSTRRPTPRPLLSGNGGCQSGVTSQLPSPKACISSVPRSLIAAPAHAEYPGPVRFLEVSLPSFLCPLAEGGPSKRGAGPGPTREADPSWSSITSSLPSALPCPGTRAPSRQPTRLAIPSDISPRLPSVCPLQVPTSPPVTAGA